MLPFHFTRHSSVRAPRSRFAAALIGIAASAAAGCGASDSAPRRATVRDSAGITIVENGVADSAAIGWWTLGEPTLAVGGGDAEGPQALFRVAGALRLDDGGTVIADGGSGELRFFTAMGTHVRTVGRKGEGPGEFQRFALLRQGPADSLFVYDGALRRVSVLDPSGAFVRELQLAGGEGALVAMLADGTLVGAASIRTAESPSDVPTTSVLRPDMRIALFDANGALTDSVQVVPGAERGMVVSMSGGQISNISIFGQSWFHNTQVAALDDEVVVATQNESELRFYRRDGTLARIVRLGGAAVQATAERMAPFIERDMARSQVPDRAAYRKLLEGGPRPDYLPAVGAVFVDRADRIWVADADAGVAGPRDWTIVDSEGRRVARIRLPETFRPLDAGTDWVLGSERDDLDVERVVLRPIAAG